MPTISGVGKRSPTSTTTIRPSYSTTVMFLPISPRPPRGSTRSVLTHACVSGADEQAVAVEHRADRVALLRRSPPRAAGAGRRRVAEQVQRGLRAGRARGHEQRLVDVAQRRVDLGAVLGLVDHAPHLGADDVARDEDPAGAAHVERARERAVVAGVEREAVDRRRSSALACLTQSMPVDLGELGEQVGGHVGAGARGDVVEQDRHVGGPRDRFVVAREARARLGRL